VIDELRTSAAHCFVTDLQNPILEELDLHHLRKVLRVRDGERITLSDGNGQWCSAYFTKSGILRDGEIFLAPHPAHSRIAVVPLKGDRTELVVQKATEIGISEIVIVEPTARSVVRWDERKQKSEMQRLGRIAREASMQSRRVFLPHVTGPKPIKELAGDGFSVAEPGATGIFSGLSVLIGPEGGFTEEELGLFNGSVDLGQTILRAETAAIVASALVMANAKRVIQ